MTSESQMDAKSAAGFDLRPGARPSAYQLVKASILDGSLAPGSQLIESQVAAWCGVSRTPVREALTRLEQDGLVERTDRGLVVRERSPEEILDIYEVRIALEATAARLAAERHTSFDRMRLEQALRLAEAADAADGDDLARRNREFHRSVWLSTHNEALIDLLDRLNLHLLRYPATTLSHPGRWDESLVQHTEIVEAIIARDEDRAEKLGRDHFTIARDIRMMLYQTELEA